MSMIPIGSGANAQAEAGEINSLEQQIRAQQGPPMPKGHQARTTPHKDGMTYGERGDQVSKKAQPMKKVSGALKGFVARKGK